LSERLWSKMTGADPAVLDIQVRYLRRLVAHQAEEIEARDKTIHELMCDLVAERQRHSQSLTPLKT
jgi:hypothetical protein